MVKFADISEYYVGELAIQEEKDWLQTQQYKNYLWVTQKVISDFNIRTIVEIGCGTGLIPAELPDTIDYVGVDRNPTFLEWARSRNPNRKFVEQDIREFSGSFDLVLCFACLKHFGLHEWDNILSRVLSLAPIAIIEMQIGTADLDNGTSFHHTFVTQDRIDAIMKTAQHSLLVSSDIFKGSVPGCDFTSKILVTRHD